MAVRIYTLSKELKIDSKELVDLCTRAGIQDKGSALASMSDEEVAKLKEFIAGKSRPAERAPERPVAASAVASHAAPKPGASGLPVTPAMPVMPAMPVTPALQVTPVMPAMPAMPRAAGTMTREDYIAPAGIAARGKPPEMTDSKSAEPRPRPAGLRPSAGGARPVPRPAFKLAPLPAAGRPPVARVSQEPMAQKPDVKLPLDAIRSAKAGGSKPLAEHMRKHEQRQGEASRPRIRQGFEQHAAKRPGRDRAVLVSAVVCRAVLRLRRSRSRAGVLGGRL